MSTFLVRKEIEGAPLPCFDLRFPDNTDDLDQDEEWFEVKRDGAWKRIRMHDYAAIYSVPGLYEAIVYRHLQCKSPRRVVRLLDAVLEDWPVAPSALRILDLGAGNGIVAERLRTLDVGYIVGADLIPEAKLAAERDRGGTYDEYIVGDITELPASAEGLLADAGLNCMVSVAALGFGDIPPEAFAAAYNYVADGGWTAFTIKRTFLSPSHTSGFSSLIRGMIAEGFLEVQAHHRYCHRLSLGGQQIFYLAIVARKLRSLAVEDVVRLTEGRLRSRSSAVTDLALGS